MISRRWGVGLVVFLVLLSACRVTNDFPAIPTPSTGQVQLLLTTSDLAAEEESRVAFALVGPDGGFIEGATVAVAICRLRGDLCTVTYTGQAAYRALEFEQPHIHATGETHIHRETRGVYVVDGVPFTEPGDWGMQADISGVPCGPCLTAASFEVKERSATPTVGAAAPMTRQRTAKDVSDLKEISSREPPLPAMYQATIADAVASGKPSVIAFSTPAYCQSRVCGPVLEAVIHVMPDYQGRVEFVHVEPYDLIKLRTSGTFELVPAAVEWGLPSEPWTFVVDAEGRIAAKFEGIVTPDELRAALDRALK